MIIVDVIGDLKILLIRFQVTIELVKVVMKSPAEDFKNCFMNLALPYVIFSQPGPPEVTVIRCVVYSTLILLYSIYHFICPFKDQ